MKAKIARFAIEKALHGLEGVFKNTSEHNLPILQRILIKTSDKTITLTATDLYVTLEMTIGADVMQEGTVLPLGKKLVKVIDALKDSENIGMESAADKVVITGDGNASYKLYDTAPDDYPDVKLPDSIGFTEVKREDLLSIIQSTAYAADSKSHVPAYTGICLAGLKDELRGVATNGYKLAITRSAIEGKLDIPDQGIIIPTNGAKEIVRLLKRHDDSETVDVGFNLDTMIVRSIGSPEDTVLTIKLVDAVFPDYKKAIPNGGSISFVAEKAKLLRSLRRMKVVAKEDTTGHCRVSLTGSGNRMTLETENDGGYVCEEIDMKDRIEDPFQVSVNANYLLDAVKTISADDICISYKEDQMLSVNGDGKSLNIVAVLRN